MSNVFSPRDLASRPDNMDETVLHTHQSIEDCDIINDNYLMCRINIYLGST